MATKKVLPDRGSVDKAVAAAAGVVTRREDKSKAPLRTIAVRINEVDYNRLNSLFAAQGTNLAAAGRAAIFHLAEQIEAGIFSIPNGVIYKNSRT